MERIVIRLDPADGQRMTRALEAAGLSLVVAQERMATVGNWTIEYMPEPVKETKREPVFRYPI